MEISIDDSVTQARANREAPVDVDQSFPEGGAASRTHRFKERSPTLVAKAKKLRLRSDGALRCDVCEFSFEEMYGDVGRGRIEVHHLTPVAKLARSTPTTLADLALLRSNCHSWMREREPCMSIPRFRHALILALGFLVIGCVTNSIDDESDTLRQLERERLRALVEADVQRARELHAPQFQLVNPRGETLTKDAYLGGIESGRLDYLLWEPVSDIAVRMHGDIAVLRYRSRLEIVVDGQRVPEAQYWHTDSYERQAGRWQVVWSQATLAAP